MFETTQALKNEQFDKNLQDDFINLININNENDIEIKKVLQANDINTIKYFENVKETLASLRKKLENNKHFKNEYKIILDIEKYFNTKNLEELNEEQLEQLKLKIKDIFVNTLYKNINKKKEILSKEYIKQNVKVLDNLKQNTEQKLVNFLSMQGEGLSFIIDFAELMLDTTNKFMFLATNTFINKIQEQTIKDIQLNLESKFLNLEAIDKETLIKKLEITEQKLENLNKELIEIKNEKKQILQQKNKLEKELKNNGNNKELQKQIEQLKQLLKELEERQKNIRKEIEQEQKQLNLYAFNMKTSNTYMQEIAKQKQDKKLELDLGITPQPSKRKRKQNLKM